MADVDENVLGAFSEDYAIRLSGVSRNQLRLWDRSGLLPASYAAQNRRQPYSRVYSFRDLVSLRVLNRLRNEYRVSSQHLHDVAKQLASFGPDKWISTTLYVLGKKVVFDDPNTNQRREIVSHQRVFDIPLRAAVSDTLKLVRESNERSVNHIGHIVQNRFIQSNEKVFAGTRIPESAVVEYLKRGRSDDEIIAEFPNLKQKDIESVRSAMKHNVA